MSAEAANSWPNVVVTGHDLSKQGKSVYIDAPQPKQATPLTKIVYGIENESWNGKIDLNNDDDLKNFQNFNLTKNGFIPKNGCRIMAGEFPAGMNKREDLHRTFSVDIIVVVQGKIICHLDSGEEKTINVGDVLIQRGTMHSWSNPSSTESAKIVGIVLPSTPIEGAAEGKVLA